MNRESVVALLQLVKSMRLSLEEAKRIVDEEGLQVSDRHVIEHAIATITSEIEVLSQALAALLEDPSKSG